MRGEWLKIEKHRNQQICIAIEVRSRRNRLDSESALEFLVAMYAALGNRRDPKDVYPLNPRRMETAALSQETHEGIEAQYRKVRLIGKC